MKSSDRRACHFLVIMVFAAVIGWALIGGAVGQHSNPWLLEWISGHCCVTNDCCYEITSRDVEGLPDDNWKILASGQVLKRTAYSPDGRWYRCACDKIDDKWVVFSTAYTRCIFPPLQGSWLR